MSDHCHSASLSAFGGTDVVKHLCWLLLELMSAILQVTELNLNFFKGLFEAVSKCFFVQLSKSTKYALKKCTFKLYF